MNGSLGVESWRLPSPLCAHGNLWLLHFPSLSRRRIINGKNRGAAGIAVMPQTKRSQRGVVIAISSMQLKLKDPKLIVASGVLGYPNACDEHNIFFQRPERLDTLRRARHPAHLSPNDRRKDTPLDPCRRLKRPLCPFEKLRSLMLWISPPPLLFSPSSLPPPLASC